MITEKDILKTANLAKLEINEDEIPFYINEIKSILDVIDDIDVSAEDVFPFDNPVDFKLLREDRAEPSLENSQVISNTKDSENGFFVLRKKA